MSHTNESDHMQISTIYTLVEYCYISHLHIILWGNCVAFKYKHVRHVTYSYEPWYIRMSHVTYEWVMSNTTKHDINSGSSDPPLQTFYVAYEKVRSHAKSTIYILGECCWIIHRKCFLLWVGTAKSVTRILFCRCCVACPYTQMRHVAYEWAMSYTDELCDI